MFVGLNKDKIRKCKWCDNHAKKNIRPDGRNKGYYRTCGNSLCLQQQYKNEYVCLSKGKARNLPNYICACCDDEFKPRSPHHVRYCLECVPENKWRARAQRYGIGKKQWDKLLLSQNGLCKLCDNIPEAIDHCHKTNNVRGLLCGYCNIQIAKMDKDREWLIRVIKYIGEINVPI